VFEEIIGFTETGKSSGTILRANIGDELMLTFEDSSPVWETVEMGDVVSEVVKTTAIMGILAALPVPASPPVMVDLNGNPVAQVRKGITVIIQTTIQNIDPISHAYTVLFQVKDARGVVVQLSFVSGTIAAGESVPVGASWTPPSSGSFTVEVFVVKNLAEPTALSLVQSETVTVS
jgi:hypothetical protein